MATLTFEDKQKNGLLKKFHAMLGRTGNSEIAKEGILCGFGVASSRDLSAAQLIEACNALDKILNPKLAELDTWRKRLMASIGGWLRATNISSNAQKIRGIACRASQRDDFNDIPLEQLRSLCAAFNKKQKDLKMTENLTNIELDRLTLMN